MVVTDHWTNRGFSSIKQQCTSLSDPRSLTSQLIRLGLLQQNVLLFVCTGCLCGENIPKGSSFPTIASEFIGRKSPMFGSPKRCLCVATLTALCFALISRALIFRWSACVVNFVRVASFHDTGACPHAQKARVLSDFGV